MKILLIHGIGFHESTDQLNTWVPEWLIAIKTSASQNAGLTLNISDPFGADSQPSGRTGDPAQDPGVLYFENLIRDHKAPSGSEYLGTVASLTASLLATTITDAATAITGKVTDAFGHIFRRDRGMLDTIFPEELKWKAREVAAWAADDKLRSELRERVAHEIMTKNPDVVIAHSYGGLILYDTCLFHSPNLLEKRHLITLGTQVGNPLLRREFGGYQFALHCRHWFNLYNPYDKVFVSSLAHIRADNFTQILTPHHVGSGHDGATYLSHPDFAALAWPHIENQLRPRTNLRTLALDAPAPRLPQKKAKTASSHSRALLIGIDHYSHPTIPTLHGCVNDTFQLSATLQEANIDHRDVRLIHNQHATRANLLKNIRWLLEDSRDGDHRILSFSGHGHRRPSYDPQTGEPLEMHEILCTHDYDPSLPETGLRDADFQDLYANLPRGVHLMIFLDCCHSGGITRSGGPAIRSFSGPADIQHESSRWNAELEMWEQGPLLEKTLNPQFLPATYHSKELADLWQQLRSLNDTPPLTKTQLHQREQALYYGTYGDTRRIGRATPLRDVNHTRYDENAAILRENYPNQPPSPFLPLVFMACGETEQACEYVHGAVSYGAFTYALTLTLRDIKHRRTTSLSYGDLLIETARKLRTLGYTQTPDILGPPGQLTAKTPFSQTKAKQSQSYVKTKTATKSARKKR